jgi:hypothetical protein
MQESQYNLVVKRLVTSVNAEVGSYTNISVN